VFVERDRIERAQSCAQRIGQELLAPGAPIAHLPGQSRRSRLRAEAGWTLMETLVVTTILLVLTGIAVPQYSALATQMRASAAATQLLGDLNFARAMSVRTGVPHYISVSGGTGVNYQVQRSAAPPAIAPATDPVVRNEQLGATLRNIVFSLAGAAADPYGNAASAPTPTGQVAFDIRGLPSQAATYFIASSDNKNSYAISVTGAGRARLWTKTGGTWH